MLLLQLHPVKRGFQATLEKRWTLSIDAGSPKLGHIALSALLVEKVAHQEHGQTSSGLRTSEHADQE